MSQEEIKTYFNLERKKHFDFFLPYYISCNWQVIEDNINSDHKNDWDVKLETFAGQFVLVDEKVRKGEHSDFLLEVIQDIKTGALGWFFSKHDWILYGSWDDLESVYPTSLYLIKSKELEEYVLGLNGFIKTCISKRGWGNTWNIILYWDELISKSIAQKLI
jgi:hypothetical protein